MNPNEIDILHIVSRMPRKEALDALRHIAHYLKSRPVSSRRRKQRRGSPSMILTTTDGARYEFRQVKPKENHEDSRSKPTNL